MRAVHMRPINQVFCLGPLLHASRREAWTSHLAVGFALRCIQRFSRPDVATRRCPGRDNRCTSGPSVPVLSY